MDQSGTRSHGSRSGCPLPWWHSEWEKGYFDDFLLYAGLEVFLRDLLDGWGEVEGHFAHGGNERLFDEVESEWKEGHLWVPET